MKTRNGFVSNSSSSSFLIYGIRLDDFTINKLFDKFNSLNLLKSDETDSDCILDALEHYIKDNKLNIALQYGQEDKYLGRSFDDIDDNETEAQFKQSIQNAISELTGRQDITCLTHEESWYNG